MNLCMYYVPTMKIEYSHGRYGTGTVSTYLSYLVPYEATVRVCNKKYEYEYVGT